MLGKLWTIGAVAAILMMPTALSAQVGGAINPGVHVGGAVNAGGAVRGRRFLAFLPLLCLQSRSCVLRMRRGFAFVSLKYFVPNSIC